MAEEDLIQIAGYEMKREIGSGGMARVFLATQTSLGREVAIKVLRKDLAAVGEDFQKRFLHEGQMLAKLVHPNIVAIHDIGQTEDVSYMAMELLKGGTLNERIKKGLSVAEVIRITTQMAHALQLAHQNHIVHRDLKPSNIMFRDEITPVLTDFGIARKTDTEHRLTKTGMVVGTPYYMSPEQITGRDIDGRSDIYSLGIMFYELLSGELPFRAEEPLALAMQHVQEPPPPLPEKVHELQPVMDQLLCKNPDDRYQSMIEFCEDIKELVMNETAFREQLSGETRLFNSDQFSDPRFGTGGVRVPERINKDTRTSSTKARARRAPPAGGATAIMDTTGRKALGAKSGFGWKIPAVVATVLIAAVVGVYMAFFSAPTVELDERDRIKIRTLLTQANAAVQRGDYYGEGSDNAVAKLQQVYAIAPEHPEARDIGRNIASIIEGEVLIDIDDGKTDAAMRKMEVALSVAPDYASLAGLRDEIQAKQAEIERRERLDQLIAEAQAHEEAGRLLEPEGDNAYVTYQQIHQIDAANPQASAGLQNIQDQLLEQVRQAVEANELERAGQIANRAMELFPNASAVAEVRQEVNEANRRLQEETDIQRLLTEAERQLAAEQYVFPPGDNALESYQTILSWQPDRSEARAGLARIAEYHETQARLAYQANDFGTAADLASSGLRAQPENQNLLVIQSQATERLDAKARQVERELQLAERLVQEGQFLSGPNGGAIAAYQRVLETNPGNLRAKDALARLPDQVYSAAQQMQRDGNYSGADRLLNEAVRAYDDQARFAELKADVSKDLNEQERRLRLGQMLADSQRLVQVRPVTRTTFDQAAVALKEILAEYPSDVRARAQLGELMNALAEEANRISEQGNHLAAFRLIDYGLEQFEGNNELLTARNTVATRQARQMEEEAARLAAMSGTLAVDAKPWGEVVEIRDADGNLAQLPSDATTPLVISLLEGNYSVVVRGGNSDRSTKLDVAVQRQQLSRTRAEFDSMTADTYFQNSGW